jgi:hypothetical protein
MRFRYITYLFLTLGMNLFFWYYIMTFCAVYVTTSVGWLYSAVLDIIVTYFILQILDPLTQALCRSIVVNFQFCKSGCLMYGQKYLCMVVGIVCGG